jgi:hypothetical protein
MRIVKGRTFISWILLTGLWLANPLFLPGNVAYAQTSGRATINSIETGSFPQISVFFEAYDAAGNFIHDLTPAEIQVIENNADHQPDNVTVIEPGVQFILAFNTSPALATHTGDVSYFQKIQDYLLAWISTQSSSHGDDYSLATSTGLQAIRLTDPLSFQKSLSEFQPDLPKSQANLISLSSALDLATDVNPRPYMKRAILFITPPLSQTSLAALPNVADRAAQLGVRVFAWLVTPEASGDAQNTGPLSQLAEKTGGRFFSFGGSEILPDPNDYLEGMRYLYRLDYTSAIKQGGAQHLSLNIKSQSLTANTEEKLFSLSVLPPNPFFLSPPAKIELAWSQDKDKTAVLAPETLDLPMMVEFPDGHTRELKHARLYVDGVMVSEKTSPPYNSLTWPLSGYTQTGQHQLHIEVEDGIGFVSTSIDTPVEVVTPPISNPVLGALFSSQNLPLTATILVSAFGLVFVVVFLGKRLRRIARQPADSDPLTQPVAIKQEMRPISPNAATWPRPALVASAPASLQRLSEDGSPVPNGAIPLLHHEITLGSDPRQATCVLDSSSVSPLHARLSQSGACDFVIADAGSIAGTWVNYAPVSNKGIMLKHGDFIQLGRVAFRFELKQAPPVTQPQVIPIDKNQL